MIWLFLPNNFYYIIIYILYYNLIILFIYFNYFFDLFLLLSVNALRSVFLEINYILICIKKQFIIFADKK